MVILFPFPFLPQLNRSAKINRDVSLIKLAQRFGDLKAGTECLVAGWGVVDTRQMKPADTLREVNVTIIERSICNDKKHYNLNPVVTMNMVCAGSKKGGKDSCMVRDFTYQFSTSVGQRKVYFL